MALTKVNFNAFETGEEYLKRLQTDSAINFKLLLSLLSSYWKSSIDGPNYARELKAIAIELARVRIILEETLRDNDFTSTRGEFLYQTLASLLLPNSEKVDTVDNDIDFRVFLNKLLSIYYAGSTLPSVQAACDLIIGKKVKVREGGNGIDDFQFDIDILMNDPSEVDQIKSDKTLRVILALIKPAHNLFRIRYVLSDEYVGSSSENTGTQAQKKISDFLSIYVNTHDYEDFRYFSRGIEGIDDRGFLKKKPGYDSFIFPQTFPSFLADPASFNLSVYFSPDGLGPGDPLDGIPSYGLSGSKVFTPISGVTNFSDLHGSQTFVNSSATLSSSVDPGKFTLADVVDQDSFTIFMVLYISSFSPTGTVFYDVPGILNTFPGQNFGIGLSKIAGVDKVVAGVFDSTFVNISSPISVGPNLVIFRKGTSGIQLKVNGGVWGAPVPAGPIANLGEELRNASVAGQADTGIGCIVASKSHLDDTDSSVIVNYLVSKFGL